MADPFEVRMRFTSQLQHLNASVTSSQKAALYALKYRDMDEDLHSCILEQLERNSMNTRANIMYFIEHLCDMAQKENHLEFVHMVQRDILAIVDAVAPGDGSGAANVKVVRRVLNGLHTKNVLPTETLAEIEACLAERDTIPPLPLAVPAAPSTAAAAAGGSPMHITPTTTTANAAGTAPTSFTTALPPTAAADPSQPPHPAASTSRSSRRRDPTAHTNGIRLDKRQIEQRIEEDRERHKRLRESIWAVEADGDREFERLWGEGSEVGEDDLAAAEEEREERVRAGREGGEVWV